MSHPRLLAVGVIAPLVATRVRVLARVAVGIRNDEFPTPIIRHAAGEAIRGGKGLAIAAMVEDLEEGMPVVAGRNRYV